MQAVSDKIVEGTAVVSQTNRVAAETERIGEGFLILSSWSFSMSCKKLMRRWQCLDALLCRVPSWYFQSTYRDSYSPGLVFVSKLRKGILADFAQQRETIQRTRRNMAQTDAELNEARGRVRNLEKANECVIV